MDWLNATDADVTEIEVSAVRFPEQSVGTDIGLVLFNTNSSRTFSRSNLLTSFDRFRALIPDGAKAIPLFPPAQPH